MPVTASLCADSVQSGVVACDVNHSLDVTRIIDVDTDLPDINVVKCSSFSAGQTVERSEVIPKHPVNFRRYSESCPMFQVYNRHPVPRLTHLSIFS